ncbi:MAG: hypothetical protein ACUVX8_06545 [Candidatus Zipacnadales bacterium]
MRPCTHNPLAAGAVAFLILVISFGAQLAFGGAWGALLTLVLLSLSVASYYTRTTYELSGEEAIVRGLFGTHRRQWNEIQAIFPDAEGVLLSPLKRPSRLAYTRGLYIRFNNNREEVLGRVKALMEQAANTDRAASPNR